MLHSLTEKDNKITILIMQNHMLFRLLEKHKHY